MPGTDPPLRPSDPQAFRHQVYLRATHLRRRRIATTATGIVAGATVIAVLLIGSLSPLIRPSNTRLAIGSSTTSIVATTQPTGTGAPSTAVSPPTVPPSSTQIPTTTSNPPPPVTAPTSVPTSIPTSVPSPVPSTLPATTTSPPTTVTTPTIAPPTATIIPGACGQPPSPAAALSPAALKQELVGTWLQCAGPSIFGAQGGGALEILPNGTWRQLASTPTGWEPLAGPDDAGTWQVLASATSASAATSAVVRFVAAAGEPGAAAPKDWTTLLMLTGGRPYRAQFVEGTIIANYEQLTPSTSGASTPSA